MSWPLIQYVLKAALRDRVFTGLIILFFICVLLSLFFGAAALVEKHQFIGVFAAYSLRLTGVLGLVLFTVFYIRRSVEAHDVEFLLARPISRPVLILSYAAAFSFLAFLFAVISGLLLLGLGIKPGMGLLLWLLSIAAENMIMVNVAMFFALSLSSATGAAMATGGFYVLSRMTGQILGIIDGGDATFGAHILGGIMQVVSIAMPRLDLLGQSSWILYGPDPSAIGFGFVTLQGIVFSALAVSAAALDMARRQF